MGQSSSKTSLQLLLPNGMQVSYDQEITVAAVLFLFPDHSVSPLSVKSPRKGIEVLPPDEMLRFGQLYAVLPNDAVAAMQEDAWWLDDVNTDLCEDEQSAKTGSPKRKHKHTAALRALGRKWWKGTSTPPPASPPAISSPRLVKSLTAPKPNLTPLVARDESDSPTNSGRSTNSVDWSFSDSSTPGSDGPGFFDWPTSLESYGWTPDSPPVPGLGSVEAREDACGNQEEEADEEFRLFEEQLKKVQEGSFSTGPAHRPPSKWKPRLECIYEASVARTSSFNDRQFLKALTSRW